MLDEEKIELGKAILKGAKITEALTKIDNKKLAWLLLKTEVYNNLVIFSMEECIFEEIIKRLYPEYDGDKVSFEDWGWKTPEGDIIYMQEAKQP